MAARHDLATEPGVLQDLLDARRATAFCARKLNELADEDLDAPALVPGWTRKHVIAHLGYNARAICRLVNWANTGVETPMYTSAERRVWEIERGATLAPHALRHLFEHSAVSLNVEWRDTPDKAWAAIVRTGQGREVPLSESPWMRIRELWIHALDFDNGARWSDVPAHVACRMLGDITAAWRARGLPDGFVLIDAAGEPAADSAPEGQRVIEVRGGASDLLAWATGRGRPAELDRLEARARLPGGRADSVKLPAAPRWL